MNHYYNKMKIITRILIISFIAWSTFAEKLIAQTGRLAPAKRILADPIDFKNFLFDLLLIIQYSTKIIIVL